MLLVDCKRDAHWLSLTLEAIAQQGLAVVKNVLSASFLEATRERMYRVQKAIRKEVSAEQIQRAGEVGVLRLMLGHDAHFFQFLELPEVLQVLDKTVSETCIMHLQNGLILPPVIQGYVPSPFQNRFHMDFPRVLNGYLASINLMFTIDEYSRETGGTMVVPGSHQQRTPPSTEYLEANAVTVECPAGSMIVFDSTLYHKAGTNTSGKDRLAINHLYTRSFFKQQLDFVRALGDAVVLAQSPRTQQLLGWYSRVVTSLDEYYRPEHERLYRKGQG